MEFYLETACSNDTSEEIFDKIRQNMEKSQKFDICRALKLHKTRPYMLCHHRSTRIYCIFYLVESEIDVINYTIIRHLINYDENIKEIAILLHCWLQTHECRRGYQFNHHTVLWLLFFYLQQLRKPMLPPIIFFQTKMEPVLYDSDNLAFNFSLKSQQSIGNNLELFLGFFKFYDKFDFDNQLISPLYGRTFPRANFEREFPNYFQRYRQILNANPMKSPLEFSKFGPHIQNPFSICRTLPTDMTNTGFTTFKTIIGLMANACRLIRSDVNATKDLFLTLFDINLHRKLKNIEIETLHAERMGEEEVAEYENMDEQVTDEAKLQPGDCVTMKVT